MPLKLMKSILFVLFLSGNIYAEGFFAGGVSSVNSDSSLNALRNPALMSKQPRDNVSIFYQYSYLLSSDAGSDVKVGAASGGSDAELSEDFNGALYFSSVLKSGRSSYGFGISKNGEDQITLSSSETDTRVGAYTAHSTEENKTFGSDLLLAYSYKINNNDSIGLRIETSASYKSEEKDEITSTLSTKKFLSEKTRITTGVVIGYNYRDDDLEFGAMLNTGNYGFERQSYELTSNSVNSKSEVSDYYMHDDGTGVMIGFGIRPISRWKLSMEAGYIIPFSFEEKSCNDSNLAESTSEISIIYTALARAGLNYRYNRYVDIGFGGSFITYKAKSAGDDSVQVGLRNLYIYQLISGIDIRPSDDYSLLFAVSIKRTEINSEFKMSGTEFDLFIEKNSIEALFGVSCNM